MEIRDYLRMLRRGWPAIVLITAIFVGSAGIYLILAPKRYDAVTVLYVSTSNPISIDDLQQGSQFSKSAAITYAEIIDSVTILADVSEELRPQISVDQLAEMVTATVRPQTALIDISVSGPDPVRAAAVANLVGATAVREIPRLERTATGRTLVRMQEIRQAEEPVTAASPNIKRTIALGFVVGLCVGLAVTIIAQTLDSRIRRVQEVRQLVDVPLLAAVPRLKRSQQRGLVVRDRPSSEAGEAFRALRTNIGFLESKDRRSLLITAVDNDRDGALVPANLAWSLAQTGQRILLVDLDLRRSAVAEILGMTSAAGMSDLLAGQDRLENLIRPTDHPYLSVVLSGTAQPGPSELLSTPAMAGALKWMERQFDHVILHAPPLLSYTDAAVVSVAVGGTLITVAAGSTQAQHLTTALLALANVRVKPRGLVLTHVDSSSIDLARIKGGGGTRLRGRAGRIVAQPLQWEWPEETANGSYRPTHAYVPAERQAE
jgi:capsular exopolysaccharide synthesis family protein